MDTASMVVKQDGGGTQVKATVKIHVESVGVVLHVRSGLGDAQMVVKMAGGAMLVGMMEIACSNVVLHV